MIEDFVSEHAERCEATGDMWLIHSAALAYFQDNYTKLSPQEIFVLGRLFECSSVDSAKYIYGEYKDDLA